MDGQQLFLTFCINAQREENGFIYHTAVLPDFDNNINNRIDRIQRPVLPFGNLLFDRISPLGISVGDTSASYISLKVATMLRVVMPLVYSDRIWLSIRVILV